MVRAATPSPYATGSFRTRQQARVANFDAVARVYRWAEYVALGTLLKRTREHFLPALTGVRHATLLGDGDGRFTAALLRKAPEVTVCALDSSRAMLQLLRARCARQGDSDRVTTQVCVAPEVILPRNCDLLVSHFFLDCLSQGDTEALAERLAAQCKPGCRWLVSDFGLPRAGLARWLARRYIQLLYLAFRLLTKLPAQGLPDAQTTLAATGFRRIARAQWLGGFLYTELWERTATG